MKHIPLISNTIDNRDILSLINFLSQDPQPRLSKGELTTEFEKKFAEYIGVKHSMFVNSGSSAILLSLYALLQAGRLKNNIIAVPAVSWVTDITSVMQLGLTPKLVDCNLNDLSVDLGHLELIFQKEKPAALILVSVLGLVPKMYSIIKLCEEHGVELIEDVCESMGSEYIGQKLGSLGATGCFSTYFSHHFSTVEGGLITTNDTELYELLLSLRSHGWSRDLPKSTSDKLKAEWNVDKFRDLYTFYYNGFNLRPTDIQAQIGLGQLKKLPSFVKARNENFKYYQDVIKTNRLNITLLDSDYISNFAYPYAHENINEIIDDLTANGVELRPIIAGNMGNKPFWIKAYGQCILPNADMIDKMGIYIPNSHELKKEDIDFIAEILNKYS